MSDKEKVSQVGRQETQNPELDFRLSMNEYHYYILLFF